MKFFMSDFLRNTTYYMLRALDKVIVGVPLLRRIVLYGFFDTQNSNADRDGHDSGIDSLFKDSLSERNNLPGVTAVYRVKNAEEFLRGSLISIIPLAQEIVIVDNGSTDNTKEVIDRFTREYGSLVSVRYYEYDKRIGRAGAGYRKELEEYPDRSIASFYNFCFSKATKDYVVKVDAHLIYSLNRIRQIQKSLSSGYDIIYYRGLEYLGKILSVEPYVFKRNISWEYFDSESYELLKFNGKYRRKFIVNPAFIHIKRIIYISGILNDKNGIDALYEK